jgi:hypothetical protein
LVAALMRDSAVLRLEALALPPRELAAPRTMLALLPRDLAYLRTVFALVAANSAVLPTILAVELM